jgi:hypothetical protein
MEKNFNFMKANEMLDVIHQREPEAAEAVLLVIEHIAGTYSDKYDKGINVIDTKQMLYSKDGAILNTYQVARYLQRYNTSGAVKSGLVKDLFKAVHYLVFEITRRIKTDKKGVTEFEEPKH